MRKVISVIAILLGAIALVVGIGQKTFWAPPETVTASMPEFNEESPLTVIQPSVQNPGSEPVELVITGKGRLPPRWRAVMTWKPGWATLPTWS